MKALFFFSLIAQVGPFGYHVASPSPKPTKYQNNYHIFSADLALPSTNIASSKKKKKVIMVRRLNKFWT